MNRIAARATREKAGGPGALHAGTERRLQEQRDQAGRLRPLWGHQLLPDDGQRAPDQNGPGRQTGEGGQLPAKRSILDREGATLYPGRRTHLAPAAP